MTPEEIASMQKENEDLKQKNTDLAAENAKQQSTIEKQAAVIGSASTKKEEVKVTAPKDPITIDKEKYQITLANFRLPGETSIFTADQILVDKELQKKILAINGQSILKKLV